MESIPVGSRGRVEEHFTDQREESEETQATPHPQHSSQCANVLISQNANRAEKTWTEKHGAPGVRTLDWQAQLCH